jgi:large subunit ribosomal protein L13
MKIVDGQGITMGRLASSVAKELLKGEEIAVVNCNETIISGSRKNIQSEFSEKRGRYGSSQKGPKHIRSSDRIVKRAIRGMLPDHRMGRGREAFKRLKCYTGVPKELEGKEIVGLNKEKKMKSIKVSELNKR